jgi:hypothetical protein
MTAVGGRSSYFSIVAGQRLSSLAGSSWRLGALAHIEPTIRTSRIPLGSREMTSGPCSASKQHQVVSRG